MRRIFSSFFVILLAGALGACFHSTTSLISPDDADYPVERFTYQPPDNEPAVTMARIGDDYVDEADETAPKVRFKAVRDDIYVAQGEFVIEDLKFYAFTLVRFSPDEDKVSVYTSDSEDAGVTVGETVNAPFSSCEHLPGAGCFDDLDTYLTFALDRLDKGEAADHEFELIEFE